MKITFLEPPSVENQTPERFAGCTYELYHFPDLANLYPLACLLDKGYEVNYIDSLLDKLDETSFLQKIKNDNSDIYVFHSVILAKKTDLYYQKKIRELKPDATIIFHGPEPTRVPETYLENDKKTIVLLGEIEYHLMEYLEGKLPKGLAYWKDDKITKTEPDDQTVNMDDLPILQRKHPVLQKYFASYSNPKFHAQPYTIMMTSRGCAFRCYFCVPNSISFAREIEGIRHFGKKPKPNVASAEHVIAEFKQIKADGFRSVMIVDDQFLWSKERTFEICEGIKDLGIEWGCLSRADFLTEYDICQALADAGCVVVDIGVESLKQSTLDFIRKDLTVEQVELATKNLKKAGVEPKFNIMFGTCPNETPQDIIDTVDKLIEMDIKNVMFSIATPFKGTEFHVICKEKGYLVDDTDEINPLGKSVISYPSLSREELEKMQSYAYKRFYLRPKAVWNRLTSYRSLSDVWNDIKIVKKLFF